MTDLAARMRTLRDRKGWRLTDGLIRVAARNEDGSVESLDRAFRRTGVAQTPEVLGQLLNLRAEAERELAQDRPPIASAESVPPSAPGSAATSPAPSASPKQPDGWSPPSWYSSLPERESDSVTSPVSDPSAKSPAPEPESPTGVTTTSMAGASYLTLDPDPQPSDDSGPPAWYRAMRERDDAGPPAQTPPLPAGSARPAHSSAPSTSSGQTPAPPGPAWSPSAFSGPTDRRQPVDAPIPAYRPAASIHDRTQPPTRGFEPPPTGGTQPAAPALTDDDLPDLATISPEWDAFAESDAGLQALVDSTGRTILRWDPQASAPGSTAVYLVCGSAHAVPEGPSLTDRLAVTTERQVFLPDARHRFFAVFAYSARTAADLRSATGVRHAIGRVLAEVGDLVVDPAEHGVLLSWTRPPGIERVRVMRSMAGQPLPPGPDPSLLLGFTGDAFRDTDVEPGATYTYRVYTESRLLVVHDGSVESSTGLTRTVIVPGRPDPVTGLRATIRPGDRRVGVRVSWDRPARGTVTVYLMPGEPHNETVVRTAMDPAQWALQVPLLGARILEPAMAEGERDTIGWVPLDTHVDGGRHSQWTVSVVTEFSGTRIIGAQAVVQHVGDIEELQVEERIDWQLIRSTWPTGADFLGVWEVPPGGQSHGAPARMVNRETFDQHGGVTCRLGPEPVDVLLQGATQYGGNFILGGQFRINYPGRWTVRYGFSAVGRFGSTQSLHLMVDRPGWANLSFMLVADPQGFPLRPDGPSIQEVIRGELPGSALVPGQWVVAAPEVRIPKGVHTRLLVWTSTGITPYVIDPIDAPVAPPQPPPAPALRCPRCLQATEYRVQQFRCQGSCRPELDIPMTQLLHPGSADPGQQVTDRPVFGWERPLRQEGRAAILHPPLPSASCPRCGTVSHREVCSMCHSDLPPNWWSSVVLGVVMVGARQSGKTTYLSGLVGHLENALLPKLGGYLHPIDPESEAKLAEHRSMIRAGQLFGGTRSAAENEQLLRPMVASIGRAPDGRHRALSLFDVAGEDMSTAETVRPYAPALAGADLIVILIDPLQLNGIREWLGGVVQLPEQGALPLTVVTNVVNEIRRRQGTPTEQLPNRVAVVFSKFDGIQAAAKAPRSSVSRLIGPGNALWRDPYVDYQGVYLEPDGRRVHDEVRALLVAMNERALVEEIERSFRQFQYFALSALGHGPRGRQLTVGGASPQRVGDPLRWLLWSAGWGT
jgi:hypothetical protein